MATKVHLDRPDREWAEIPQAAGRSLPAFTGVTRALLGPEVVLNDITHAPFDVAHDGTVVFVRQTRFPRVVVRNFAAEIGRAQPAR